MANRLGKLSREIEALQRQIRELKKVIAEKERRARERAHRLQARLFLERLFLPYFEGVSEGLGLTPAEAVKKLIQEDLTLDVLASNHREALEEFISQPEIKIALSLAGRVANKPPEWFKEKLPTLLEVMEEAGPEIARAIRENGGEKWLLQSLIGLRDLLFKT